MEENRNNELDIDNSNMPDIVEADTVEADTQSEPIPVPETAAQEVVLEKGPGQTTEFILQDPQPTPPLDPQPIPQPVPQPTPQPVPQPIPQPTPQPIPQPTPQPTPQPVPQPTPQPTPQPVPHSQSAAQPASGTVPQPDPQPAPQYNYQGDYQTQGNNQNNYQHNSNQPGNDDMNYIYNTGYNSNYKEDGLDETPLTLGEWVLTILAYLIPCFVGIGLYFYWAFSKNGNLNRRNYCRAALIISGIGFIIYLVFMLFFGMALLGSYY